MQSMTHNDDNLTELDDLERRLADERARLGIWPGAGSRKADLDVPVPYLITERAS
jgi:hypothetical protein